MNSKRSEGAKRNWAERKKKYGNSGGNDKSPETKRRIYGDDYSPRGRGFHLTEEHKRKIGATNKVRLKNRVVPQEVRDKISRSMTGLKKKPMSALGRLHLSQAHLGKSRGLMPQSQKDAISRGNKGKKRSWYKHETGIEKNIREFLTTIGYPFEQEKYFQGIGTVDFYLPKFNLVIECDGKYWHSLPKQKETDKWRDQELNRLGIRVVRLDEDTINWDEIEVTRKIYYYIFPEAEPYHGT